MLEEIDDPYPEGVNDAEAPSDVRKRITLKDIARADGTHITTVSLALRDSHRLPAATRTRIQRLAREMGYRPDPVLNALVSYRERSRIRHSPRQTIAYVTNWTTRWGWRETTAHPEFYLGACRHAEVLGFRLEHFWLHEPGLSHGRLSGILLNRGINGVIIASNSREFDDDIALDWSSFSAVKIDYFPHHPVLHYVTNDQCSIIRLAMRKAVEAGYKRIGFIMHRGWDHSVDHMWRAGFLVEQQFLPESDRIPALLFPEAEPVSAWFDEGAGETPPRPEVFAEWYMRWKPDVIISREAFAKPAIEAHGLRVPEDVGYADLFLEDTNGGTAGVRQNYEEVGAVAVDLLSGLMNQNKRGLPGVQMSSLVEGTWFDGASLPQRA